MSTAADATKGAIDPNMYLTGAKPDHENNDDLYDDVCWLHECSFGCLNEDLSCDSHEGSYFFADETSNGQAGAIDGEDWDLHEWEWYCAPEDEDNPRTACSTQGRLLGPDYTGAEWNSEFMKDALNVLGFIIIGLCWLYIKGPKKGDKVASETGGSGDQGVNLTLSPQVVIGVEAGTTAPPLAMPPGLFEGLGVMMQQQGGIGMPQQGAQVDPNGQPTMMMMQPQYGAPQPASSFEPMTGQPLNNFQPQMQPSHQPNMNTATVTPMTMATPMAMPMSAPVVNPNAGKVKVLVPIYGGGGMVMTEFNGNMVSVEIPANATAGATIWVDPPEAYKGY